jgi:hypothetical protein
MFPFVNAFLAKREKTRIDYYLRDAILCSASDDIG